MVILKCKMCGGDVVTTPEMSCGTCGHCGSAMTLPRVSDERRANLFNRANHFRRLNEFDKAVAAYESILNEDNADAEAHWGVVLSRYGIEYVKDPGTHEHLPTCHRVQSDSILRDPDYLMALEHAPDNGAMALYQAQAAAIGEIQKGILALSAQEEPFDVFICYKETTEGGSRSRDSVLAQDIYHQLTREKCRVFFARITLENRLGQAYEPCIFAALNSAKVMVVVGTRPEHFTAVWVRNEWSRFLSLRKQDSRKLIIPCYQEMNPYELPEELSALQSQDMGKLGFLQDLVRGIKKVLDAGKQAPVQSGPVDSAATSEVAALVKRAMLFLEDEDFKSAGEYAERVLDKNPECAEAYLVKLMVQLRLRTEDELGNGTEPLKGNSLYQKVVRFSTDSLKQRLEGYNGNRLEAAEKVRQEKLEQERRDQRELERQENLLAKAGELLDRGDLDSAAEILASLGCITAGYVKITSLHMEINARLQLLRGELTKFGLAAESTRVILERLGVEVAKFSPYPKWGLRARCRFAQFEASENIRNLQTAAATYPGSEFAIRLDSAADSLQQTLGVFERSDLSGVKHQVRVLSLAWLVLILILGAIGGTVVVAARLKVEAEERAQAKLAAETKSKVEAEERAQAKLAAETEVKKMALIPAGSFTMGNSSGDPDIKDATPISVNVSAFYMDKNLVSKAQWDEVYTWAISHGYSFDSVGSGKEANHPVVDVSWWDAVKWCNARSEQAGGTAAYYTDVGLKTVYRSGQLSPSVKWNGGYRLPTEAEWEKAARGGLSGQRFPWGNTISRSQANYSGNTSSYRYDLGPNGRNPAYEDTSPVGSYAPNGYGLNDMAGNVFQWCWDWYEESYAGGSDPHGPVGPLSNRVLRGGLWNGVADFARCTNRHYNDPGYASDGFGFRCVRGL